MRPISEGKIQELLFVNFFPPSGGFLVDKIGKPFEPQHRTSPVPGEFVFATILLEVKDFNNKSR
jgi:hypothetical protein